MQKFYPLFFLLIFMLFSCGENETQEVSSSIEVFSLESKGSKTIYTSENIISSPQWSPDGKYIFFNENENILQISVEDGLVETVISSVPCSPNYGISSDGKSLAVSVLGKPGDNTQITIFSLEEDGQSQNFTFNGDAWFHGWDPTGNRFVFCGKQSDKLDIYSASLQGELAKLTNSGDFLSNTPDYSLDGKYIYFSSDRSGIAEVWRIDANGDNLKQITSDDYNNWFPHPSPDGNNLLFLSYNNDVYKHPSNEEIQVRLMSLSDKKAETLFETIGGQGTFNMPCWSPDSKSFVYVNYTP
ncbi:hypothetical protein RCC89_12225 [Cytophagaceae bacterium ABcell3]|nr:hypothetical protein RCC89_12225 [Cytophagaceae bacterium ABcell3]